MKLVVATHNQGKVAEFARILSPMGLTPVMAEISEVAETGTTFLENALLKAESACKETGLPAVADDSGLCVDFLGGAPGVYSARYAPPGKRRLKILQKLKNVPEAQRGAAFVSAIACVFPDGTVLTATGECRGSITEENRGEGGFGYDPIFLVGDKTFAQMDAQEKDAVSHRGKALREFEAKLAELLRLKNEREYHVNK